MNDVIVPSLSTHVHSNTIGLRFPKCRCLKIMPVFDENDGRFPVMDGRCGFSDVSTYVSGARGRLYVPKREPCQYTLLHPIELQTCNTLLVSISLICLFYSLKIILVAYSVPLLLFCFSAIFLVSISKDNRTMNMASHFF